MPWQGKLAPRAKKKRVSPTLALIIGRIRIPKSGYNSKVCLTNRIQSILLYDFPIPSTVFHARKGLQEWQFYFILFVSGGAHLLGAFSKLKWRTSVCTLEGVGSMAKNVLTLEEAKSMWKVGLSRPCALSYSGTMCSSVLTPHHRAPPAPYWRGGSFGWAGDRQSEGQCSAAMGWLQAVEGPAARRGGDQARCRWLKSASAAWVGIGSPGEHGGAKQDLLHLILNMQGFPTQCLKGSPGSVREGVVP